MRLLVLVVVFCMPMAGFCQGIEEIVVTGSMIERSVPAQRVVRKADNLLLRVTITNDARDDEQRQQEIHRTLLAAVEAAGRQRNIELSAVTDNGFVIPLKRSNHRVDLYPGSRPDTSRAVFRVKTAIAEDDTDGEALVASLKKFVADLKMTGRTLVDVGTDVEVSIVNPQQYRTQVIGLMAEDVKTVTAALGDDYRIVLTGVDRPVDWARVGSVNVALYIPYEYVVVPTSIASFNVYPDY